ncbi:trypsin-like serine protease [Sinomonas sp. JGH33]|uniref:Trypsin-like serine protease n=1 Tax=Sinomonas terricola TaxID=3110330 RepID=A0ABU5T783_9MICC|nr:trypsin-like serine protease [Sinomonas sp. JGH33]MEA5455535.1 trypsin-like serine protease [Sinomonas sp. JGH33]
MRKSILAVFAAVAMVFGLAVAAGPAQASTGGMADGGAHPGVAMIVFYSAEGRFRCSASLVSPTVLLTAAHCTDGVLGKTFVTFDSVIAEQPPSGLPAASDPRAGYSAADLAGRISGTAYTDPQYSHFTDQANWNDVGVVVLDEAVSLPTYALAASGTLDALAPGDVPKTTVTAVGYGVELGQPASGPQRRVPVAYPMIRRSVDMRVQSVAAQILTTHANVNPGRDTGGICSGDSGGPVFAGGVIVAVTSFGQPDCLAHDGLQRVDIAPVQAWLAGFGVTP